MTREPVVPLASKCQNRLLRILETDLSLKKLASVMNLSPTTVKKASDGASIAVSKVFAFAKYFGVSVLEIVEEDEHPKFEHHVANIPFEFPPIAEHLPSRGIWEHGSKAEELYTWRRSKFAHPLSTDEFARLCGREPSWFHVFEEEHWAKRSHYERPEFVLQVRDAELVPNPSVMAELHTCSDVIMRPKSTETLASGGFDAFLDRLEPEAKLAECYSKLNDLGVHALAVDVTSIFGLGLHLEVTHDGYLQHPESDFFIQMPPDDVLYLKCSVPVVIFAPQQIRQVQVEYDELTDIPF